MEYYFLAVLLPFPLLVNSSVRVTRNIIYNPKSNSYNNIYKSLSTMAKSNQTFVEIPRPPVVDGIVADDLFPNNNQDVMSLFNSALDVIFSGLSTKSNHVSSVLPVSNYRDGIFTGLSTKSNVPSKATFLPGVPHYRDGVFSDSWTKGSASSSVPSKDPLLMFPKYVETMTKNNQTNAYSVPMSGLGSTMRDDHVQPSIKAYSLVMGQLRSSRLDHHVQRAIKEKEKCAVEYPHSQDLMPLENFNEDHYLYHFVREVVNRAINFKRTGSCSCYAVFSSKATVMSDIDRLDGAFSDSWTKGYSSSSVPSKETMTKNNQSNAYSVPMSGLCSTMRDDHVQPSIKAFSVAMSGVAMSGLRTSRLNHHVERAIKEKECAVEDYPPQDFVPLVNFNDDHYLYQFVREVVNRVINFKRTGSCSSDALFLSKATVMSDIDGPDGIFSDLWTKGSASSSVPLNAYVLPDPDHQDKKKHKATPIDPADSEVPNQKTVSYPKVNLIEPFKEQHDGVGISKSNFKNCIIEDYPHPSDSISLGDFNKDHYSYHTVIKCVNVALEEYTKQTELIYELVEVVNVSWTGLGGILYYITFKATSPQKELTTFEAEVFSRIDVKRVWRVGIRKSGSDWFDGVKYFPKFEIY